VGKMPTFWHIRNLQKWRQKTSFEAPQKVIVPLYGKFGGKI